MVRCPLLEWFPLQGGSDSHCQPSIYHQLFVNASGLIQTFRTRLVLAVPMCQVIKANSSYSSLLVLQPHRECVCPTVKRATAAHKLTHNPALNQLDQKLVELWSSVLTTNMHKNFLFIYQSFLGMFGVSKELHISMTTGKQTRMSPGE